MAIFFISFSFSEVVDSVSVFLVINFEDNNMDGSYNKYKINIMINVSNTHMHGETSRWLFFSLTKCFYYLGLPPY